MLCIVAYLSHGPHNLCIAMYWLLTCKMMGRSSNRIFFSTIKENLEVFSWAQTICVTIDNKNTNI